VTTTGKRERIVLHLDMDSFYASVEVQKHPELKGRPVIIGADPKQGTGRGVVSTCSYEARAFGVRSAMPISKAYALCPDAVFLPPDIPAYIEASAAVMAILKIAEYPFEQVSIDEAFLDISAAGTYGNAKLLAEAIKKRIVADLGLTSSIGIGPSKVVAKIASDFQKPDGLTTVPPDRVVEFLAPLPVRRIPGIGKKSEGELNELGIRTIGDLAGFDVQVLLARFGRGAIAMHAISHGIDEREVQDRGGPCSVSRETTFLEDTDDPEQLAKTMDQLVRDVHRNLVEEKLRFRTVTVKVRYQGFVTKTKARSIQHHTDDITTVHRFAHALLMELFCDRKIRLIGLRLSGFEEDDRLQTKLDL
jgi:DNA polymerase IV (DinB-like DNA polymerase)